MVAQQESDAHAEYDTPIKGRKIAKTTRDQDVKFNTGELKAVDAENIVLLGGKETAQTQLDVVVDDEKIMEEVLIQKDTIAKTTRDQHVKFKTGEFKALIAENMGLSGDKEGAQTQLDAVQDYGKITEEVRIQEDKITKTTRDQDVKFKAGELKALDAENIGLTGDKEAAQTELDAVVDY